MNWLDLVLVAAGIGLVAHGVVPRADSGRFLAFVIGAWLLVFVWKAGMK